MHSDYVINTNKQNVGHCGRRSLLACETIEKSSNSGNLGVKCRCMIACQLRFGENENVKDVTAQSDETLLVSNHQLLFVQLFYELLDNICAQQQCESVQLYMR